MSKPLTVVVPVYNEGQGLAAALDEIHGTLTARGYDLDLIVVDDASTDDSHAVATAAAQRLAGVRVLRHPQNLGPCSGLATGGREARHEWVLLLPADIAVPLEDVDALWSARAQADIAVGYLREGAVREPARLLQSRVYTRLINTLFGLDLRQVNFVTLYRSRVFRSFELTTQGVARHAEILVRARKAGFTLTQVPLGHRLRERGEASGSRPRVIAKTLWEILKLRATV